MRSRHDSNQRRDGSLSRSEAARDILTVLGALPRPMSMADLNERLVDRWSPHTVKHKMLELVDDGQVVRVGAGKSTTYSLPGGRQ